MLAANYRSGDDFVVEFLGHRFEFSATDFEERVIAAAVRLELLASNDVDEQESADLVELVADGRIEDPRSGLGLYLVRHWERVSLQNGESLVYWLRKLVFRGAWLDHRVKEGLLDVSWLEDTGDFGYAEPQGGRTLLELCSRSVLERAPVQGLSRALPTLSYSAGTKPTGRSGSGAEISIERTAPIGTMSCFGSSPSP